MWPKSSILFLSVCLSVRDSSSHLVCFLAYISKAFQNGKVFMQAKRIMTYKLFLGFNLQKYTFIWQTISNSLEESPWEWTLGVHSSIRISCIFSPFPASSSCFFVPIFCVYFQIHHLHSVLFSCLVFLGKPLAKISVL